MLLLTLGQGVCGWDLNQTGHGQSDIVYSFPSLHHRENHNGQWDHRGILWAHWGFTCMYMDILQLIDSASLRHRMIHCGGEVFEEFSRTFLHISMVSFVVPSGFHCLCFHWPVVPRKLSKYSTLYHCQVLPSYLEGDTNFPLISGRDENPHTGCSSASWMWEVSMLQWEHQAWGPWELQLRWQVGQALTWLLRQEGTNTPNHHNARSSSWRWMFGDTVRATEGTNTPMGPQYR